MDCPVCNSSGIADESKKCPHCNADFEAFQLTKEIEQTGKNRLLFGWIATILFFLVLIALIVFFVITPKADQPSEQETQEIALLKADIDKTKKQNEDLLAKNNELSEQLKTKEEVKAKREKVYVVEAGETLFTIARKVLGNGYKYEDIAKDNNISDPDILITGQKLVIYY
jgi:nucleoid-associated protein YgaU